MLHEEPAGADVPPATSTVASVVVGDVGEVAAADAHDVQVNVDDVVHVHVYDSGAVGEDVDGDEAYVWSCCCGC